MRLQVILAFLPHLRQRSVYCDPGQRRLLYPNMNERMLREMKNDNFQINNIILIPPLRETSRNRVRAALSVYPDMLNERVLWGNEARLSLC